MILNTILHPTDFSETAEAALDLACSLARDHQGKVVLLHVLPDDVLLYGAEVIPVPPAANNREAMLKLDALKSKHPEIESARMVTEGVAGKEIVGIARDLHCDLIVMGTHGRSGLTRLLLGSVAEQVVRHAPCPVLTVKLPHRHPKSDVEGPRDAEPNQVERIEEDIHENILASEGH